MATHTFKCYEGETALLYAVFRYFRPYKVRKGHERTSQKNLLFPTQTKQLHEKVAMFNM